MSIAFDEPRPAAAAQPDHGGDDPTAGFGRRLERKVADDRGKPLDGELADTAGTAYGADLGGVRVHDDAEAGEMASAKGFAAFTYGRDVFLSPSVDTEKEDGRFVMMHELAHVAQSDGEAGEVQGKALVGDSSEPAEADADHAAATALAGGTHRPARAARKVRGFGATSTRSSDVSHESQTTTAARGAGFDQDDAAMIYSGNWQRDFNQVGVPLLRSAAPHLFPIIDLLHTAKFGSPLGMAGGAADSPASGKRDNKAAQFEFGTYDPIEHLDNPAGLTGANVFHQNGGAERDSTHFNDLAGGTDQSYAESEGRYHAEYEKLKSSAKLVETAEDVKDPREDAFKIDESAIPVYLSASRSQMIAKLEGGVKLAAQKGTGETEAERERQRQANRDRALRYGGEALHIMQDYYAHSNFCEIAINLMLDGEPRKPDGTKGKSLVESLNLSSLNPALAKLDQPYHLNTYVHGKGSNGVDGANLTKNKREVMATGSFTTEDTIQSIKEKVSAAVADAEPFAEKASGPDPKMLALITLLQSTSKYGFEASKFTQHISKGFGKAVPAIEALTKGGSAAIDLHGKAMSAGEKAIGNAPGAKEQQAEAAKREAQFKAFMNDLKLGITKLSSGGSLTDIVKWAYTANAKLQFTALATAKAIPIIGPHIAEVIEKTIEEIQETVRKALNAAWKAAAKSMVSEFNAAVAVALKSSEVQNKTGPSKMTTPTHTDIAKDFDPKQQGTEDKFSIIEGVSEFFGKLSRFTGKAKETAKDTFNNVVGGKTGVVDGLKQAGEKLSADETKDRHEHQHRHGGAWLAPIANDLAKRSSAEILGAYHAALEGAKSGNASGAGRVTGVVEKWFAHPADCTGLWRGAVSGILKGSSSSSLEIRKELAHRIAQPPMRQAPSDQQSTGGENRHGEHDDGDHDHGSDSTWKPRGG